MNELDRLPLEGVILEEEPTRGKYGWAVINGVPFILRGVELQQGAMIFECMLAAPARYAFTVRPGDTARIYGTDDQLVAEYAVPGIVCEAAVCEIREGEMATVLLPIRFAEIHSASPNDRQRFNNTAVI
jgi:hypothetical protein